LIVERPDYAWQVEVLKVAESAVDDSKGVVRGRFAASVGFEQEC
jgi:hypothetical protein